MTEKTSKNIHMKPNLTFRSLIRFRNFKDIQDCKIIRVNGVATIENIIQ
jgi:hypothetical protein